MTGLRGRWWRSSYGAVGAEFKSKNRLSSWVCVADRFLESAFDVGGLCPSRSLVGEVSACDRAADCRMIQAPRYGIDRVGEVGVVELRIPARVGRKSSMFFNLSGAGQKGAKGLAGREVSSAAL